MDREGIQVFDESEQAMTPYGFPCSPSSGPCNPPQANLVASSQRVHVGGPDLLTPFSFGWLFLDLNSTASGASGFNPPSDPAAQQAWVIVTDSSNSQYSVALDAFHADSACAAQHYIPGW